MATFVVPAAPQAALLSSEQLKATKAQKQALETKLRDQNLSDIGQKQQDQKMLNDVRLKLAAHYRAEAYRKMTCFV